MSLPLPILPAGKVYEWADMVINIMGVPIAGIKSIEYEDNQQMVNVMGAGNRAYGRAYGNFDPKAKCTILMEELEFIQAVAPQGVIQRIPEFDITVAYIDVSLVTRVHTIKNCRFMGNSRKVQQGDTEIGIEIDLIISHVNFV
jgi:hypothetical protein